MNVKDIESHISDFNSLFQHEKHDDEDFDEVLTTIPQISLHDCHAFLAKRDATPYGQIVARFRAFVVPGLVDAYLRMSAEERRTVLDLFAQHFFARLALWSLLGEYRWRLQKAPLEEKPGILRTLLLIAVLAERYLDEVDTTVILTAAWGDAEQHGLDPDRFFKQAAAVAGQRPLTHSQTAQQLLQNFEPYDYGSRV
ncbi:MAG TPA: hypothetical protein VFS21_01815 [Roseiflexaceae bacterium]|nr:hypothetical protein [Roseiflexaceae bacterium]